MLCLICSIYILSFCWNICAIDATWSLKYRIVGDTFWANNVRLAPCGADFVNGGYLSAIYGWVSVFIGLGVRFMVFNATFNNISVISWQSVLLVEETRVPGENYGSAASHWQTLSNVVGRKCYILCNKQGYKELSIKGEGCNWLTVSDKIIKKRLKFQEF